MFSRDRPCIRSESLWQCSEENMSVYPSSSVHNCLSGCVLRLKSIILSLETRFFINLLLFSSVMFDLAEPLANQAICYVSAWLMHYGPEVHSNPVLVNLYLLSFKLQNRTLLLEIEAKRKQFLWSAVFGQTHTAVICKRKCFAKILHINISCVGNKPQCWRVQQTSHQIDVPLKLIMYMYLHCITSCDTFRNLPGPIA